MKIGIVILNWNGLDLLRKYLNEIILNSDNSTIYIIDNNSSDESVLYVRNNYKEVKVISLDKNYGFAEGYNIGLKKVEEEYVCIINNDILVTENWLDEKGFKYHGLLMNKPRGGNYHWVDNHIVRATRFSGKFTDLVEEEVKIQVFQK